MVAGNVVRISSDAKCFLLNDVVVDSDRFRVNDVGSVVDWFRVNDVAFDYAEVVWDIARWGFLNF